MSDATATRQPMTVAEIRALGTVTDVPTAGRVFGLGRASAYDLAHRGAFPCPVLTIGRRYRVPVAGILRALGVDPEHE